MNKLLKIIIAVLGAVDVVIVLITPIMLGWLWVNTFGWGGLGSTFLILTAFVSSLYRAINIGIIGFIK
jgi:uncharacterized membrane protein YccC|tara:strand:+ start:830 stop:1033 length:204 start_codon:yes stop_codon:yes gene_type:complete